ncbi:MAG: GTP-binding protein [Hungatella sp.]|nr:GTP-binding protein [Hungatella sp.]
MKKRLVLGILAHVDAGKTTLSEGILFLTGSIRRLGRVDNRDAFLDTYELERTRGITIFSKQAVFELEGEEVTLLDTPGHVDFSAEMERTLQVLDYAVLIVSGSDGVQGHTETLWRLLERYHVPVFLFINKMDQAGTDRDKLLKEMKSRLHDNCIPFDLEGTRDRETWLEELAMSGDEDVLEKYLEQGNVGEDDIRLLIARRQVFPCYFGSALKLQGVEELLKGIRRYSRDRKAGEKFAARVYKISRDQQGNRLTHMKILGGCLKVKDTLNVGKKGEEEAEEKINQIRIYSGAKYEAVEQAKPGCICAVTGPVSTYAGQALGEAGGEELPVLEPVLTYQLMLPNGCDAHTMLPRLRQMEEEEPQLHVVWNEASNEIQVQVMGQVQIEILRSLMEERFGVRVEFGEGSIVYKETIAKAVEGVGHFEPLRHYAEVHLWMEPAERGSGLQFETDCSEDVLDRNWQRLIMTHLEEKQHIGVMTGSEITDMKITLIAGRAHIKHTEGGDFRQATYRAVRQGLKEAGCRLLEPYYQFRLEIPSESTGRALSDIERMQGTFEQPKIQGDMTVIAGTAPVALMRDYQMEVVVYTKGRGKLSCSLKGYELCRNEKEVAEAIGYDSDMDPDNPTGSVFCSHGAGYLVSWDQVKDYMHVESPGAVKIRRESQKEADSPASGKMANTTEPEAASKVSRSASVWGSDEKELEAIFVRTYGERKRTLPGEFSARRVFYDQKRQTGDKKEDPAEEYLLVDGYNIIFAWKELQELAKVTIDGARHKLMDILCNYQGYRKCKLILVFDAYKVEGNIGQALKYHNIHVVYTKEAETADQYIEKLAHKMGQNHQVTVATSDGLEQLIIRGEGCRLWSAKDFREEVEQVNQEIQKEHLDRLPKRSGNYLFGQTDEELAQYLENVRLGKEKEDYGRKTDKK